MRLVKAALALIFLLCTVAFAQNASDLKAHTFEELVAEEIPCADLAGTFPILGSYSIVHCGVMRDTLTQRNMNLIVRSFRSFGMIEATDWMTEKLEDGTLYGIAFASTNQAWGAFLFEIPATENTIVLLAKN